MGRWRRLQKGTLVVVRPAALAVTTGDGERSPMSSAMQSRLRMVALRCSSSPPRTTCHSFFRFVYCRLPTPAVLACCVSGVKIIFRL